MDTHVCVRGISLSIYGNESRVVNPIHIRDVHEYCVVVKIGAKVIEKEREIRILRDEINDFCKEHNYVSFYIPLVLYTSFSTKYMEIVILIVKKMTARAKLYRKCGIKLFHARFRFQEKIDVEILYSDNF